MESAVRRALPAQHNGTRGRHPSVAQDGWFRTLIANSTDLIAVIDRLGNLLFANPVAERILGYSVDDELGRNMFLLVDPEDLDRTHASFDQLLAEDGAVVASTFRFRKPDGSCALLEAISTNCLADPEINGVVINARDITDCVQIEGRVARLTQMYELLAQTNEAMMRAADEVAMLGAVCDIAVDVGGLRMAWIGRVDRDGVSVVAAAGTRARYIKGIRIPLAECRYGPAATAVAQDRPVVVSSSDDPLLGPWRELFTAAGFQSACAVPIHAGEAAVAVLSVYATDAASFDEESVKVLVELASDVSFALERFAIDARRADAEAALRRSESRFRALVEGASDAIAVLATDGTAKFISPSILAMTGGSAEFHLGRSAFAAVHPDDAPAARDALERVLNDASRKAFVVVRLRRTDGEWRWIESSLTNMLAVPEVEGIVVNFRDVTEHRAATSQLQLQARLLDSVGEAVIATDLDGRVIYWNEAATRMYGWAPAEAIGRPVTELTTAASSEAEATEIFERLSRGESWSGIFRVRRRDGTEFEALVTDSPFVDDAGALAGVIGVSVDLTERQEAERRLLGALDFARAVTESMAEGVVALDEEGRATLVNQAAGQLFGWSPDELIGKTMHQIVHFERSDGTEFPGAECPIMRASREREVVRVAHDTFIRRDGERIPVEYVASPISRDSTTGNGCVVVFRDISNELAEERRVEEALERVSWVGRIQDALAENRFELFAQPILHLESGEIRAHELLIRLRSPGGELVSPGAFLPAAEEFGLIRQIDAWVVREACRLAARGDRLEFNLSAHSLSDPNTLNLISEALSESKAAPENLVCEITETALMENAAAGDTLVHFLRDLGCGVALDDFGAGFGGFTYLKSLPVTTLKIDIQFVRDAVEEPASRHVVQAIVNLAKAFDLDTVAEGAERAETVELLRDLGVDFVQGYAVGRPVPAAEALDGQLVAKEVSHEASPG